MRHLLQRRTVLWHGATLETMNLRRLGPLGFVGGTQLVRGTSSCLGLAASDPSMHTRLTHYLLDTRSNGLRYLGHMIP
jgi:hypothetical protein